MRICNVGWILELVRRAMRKLPVRTAGRFMARDEKLPRHGDHVDSDRAFSDRAFPTELDHDQQDKVEMDRLLLRVWFASKHHHAISRCVLSRCGAQLQEETISKQQQHQESIC